MGLATLAAFLSFSSLAQNALPGGSDVVFLDDQDLARARAHTKMATARFIRDEGQFAVIELAGDYDRDLADGGFNIDPRVAVAEEFYANHDDEYDFLVVFSGFEFETPGAQAFYLSVFNDIQGIGQNQFDNRALFDSQRLQGFIDMAAFTRYELDTLQPDFDATLDTLVHEIMHRWGVYVSYRDAAGQPNTDWLGFQDAHWSQYVSSDASVMGGAQWRDNGNSTFTALDVRRGYGAVDLYLAGFVESDPADSLFYIRNPDGDPEAYWPIPGDVTGGTAEQVAIAQIIDAEGPRVPAAAQAQREFRIGFVFLVRPGFFPAEDLLTALNDVRRGVAERFGVETRGKGILNTQLAGGSGFAVNDPSLVNGGPALNGLADFALAVDWLLAAQDPAGYWGDTPETRLRDTAVAIHALELLQIDDAGVLLGRNWIRNQSAQDNDDRAWMLASRTLAGTGRDAVLNALNQNQNADGGWGLAQAEGSSVYDTALILNYVDNDLGNEPAAVEFLRQAQRSGAGWGALRSGSNQVVTTALALRTLIQDGTTPATLDAAVNWLTDGQRANGLFGEGAGSGHETALVLNALGLVSTVPVAAIDTASAALEGLQTADGSWSGSVYTTALAIDALRNRQNANLEVSGQVQLSPASPRDGDLVTVNYTISNAGLFNTPPVTAQAYLGDPQAGGTPIGSPVPVPALQAGQDFPVQLFWDTFGLEGAQTLYAFVDNTEALAEANEVDNLAFVDVVVAPPPATADLALLANSLNFSPTVIGALPTNFQADITARNSGAGSALGSVVSLQRLRPGGIWVTLASQSADLPARSSAPVTLAAQLVEAGPVQLRLVIDPDNAVAEADENNNELAFDVATAAALDLAVLPAEVQLLTPSPTAGQDVNFQFVLRNQGTVDAPPVSFTAAVEFAGNTETLLEQVIQLNAGQADSRNLAWRASGVGAARLVVTIDSTDQAVEGDETNNQATLDFTVGSVSLPNLAVDFTELTFTPNPGLESQPLEIGIPVSNSSDVAAGPWRVEIYDGVPGEGGTLIEGQDFAGLAAGAQQQVQVTTEPLVGGGQRLYYVTVDPANLVAEFDEQDNTAFDQVDVLRLPDLAITPANVILAPTLPIPGSPLSATVTVDNLGQQPASNVAVVVFELYADGAQTQVAGPTSIAQINPDSSAEVVFNWTFGAAVDRLLVVVDPQDQVLEIRTTNNQAEVRTDLQNQNFFVSERYISPNGDGVKDTTAVGFNTGTESATAIVIQDSLGRQVRGLASGDLGNRGQFTWDGRSDRGSVVRDGDYQARLLDGGGDLLGQTVIVVDTNRSPLLDAVNTPAAYYTDLRCSVESISSPQFSADGRYLYSTQIRDLNGDTRRGIFRVPTRGRGLDQLLSDTFINQLTGGTFIGLTSALPDGRVLFTNGAGCGNCARGLWIKATPLAQPVALDIGPATQFTVLNAGAQFALIEDQADNLWKVFYDPGVPPQQLSQPGTSMNYWGAVNGGWLMSRFFSGEYFGNNVFGEHLYFISDDPGVAFNEIIFGPEVSFQISPDRRYVAAFASENQFEFSPPASGLIRAARLTAPVPEIYFEESRNLGDLWDVHVALSPANQLLILDGIEATVSVYDPSGVALGQMQLPTQLFDDYADAIPPEPGFSGPSDPYTAFASWQRVLEQDNVDRPAVTFSTDTNEFLVQLALVYPDRGGDFLAEKRVPRSTQLSQYYRASLTDLQPILVGTIAHEADDAIILPEQLEFSDPFQLNWLPREDRVLLNPDGRLDALQLIPEPGLTDLQLGVLGDAWPRNYGTMYKRLQVSQFLPPDNLKCAGLGFPTPVLESADNLMAHLEVSRFASVIELNGVAADRALQSYQLDWAFADDPDTWFTLTSASNETVIDDLLATWVPPAAGSFLIRLQVTDRAGNVAEDIRSVSWLDPANLANVELEPRYLSPNGDGIQDQATLSFRVLRPINLDATVENSAGQVVRTLSGQYPTVTGDIEALTWDGRDDAGFLVAEGAYLMRVENRRFRITLDISPPELTFNLRRAYRPEMIEERQFVTAVYSVSGTLEESNLEQALIEFRRGNEPWNELQLISQVPKDNMVGQSISRDLYVPGEFRLSAVDLAGNRAQIVASNQFDDLILKDVRQVYFIRSIDVSRPPEKKLLRKRLEYVLPPVNPVLFPELLVPVVSDRIAMAMDLTFDEPVEQYFIELAEPDNLNDWAAIPKQPAPIGSDENFELPEELNSDYRHLFVLDLSELQGLEDVYIRIRADIGGTSYYSNGMRLRLDPGLKLGTMRQALGQIADGTLEPEQDVELIRQINTQVPLKEPAITQFWVRESIIGLPANARLLVSSRDDARYFNETAFLAVTDARLEPPSEFSIQMFEVPTSPCRTYDVTWEAEFPDGVGGLRSVRFPPASVSRSCLTIETRRFAVPGNFCGESALGQVQLRVVLNSEDPDILPISLDVFDRDATGQEVLIANVVAPQVGVSYPLDIDLDPLVTGQRALTMRVIDSVGDVSEERVLLPVDRQPPQLSLDFPGAGEQLCAVQNTNGAIEVPLEGAISDDFSGQFAWKAFLGSGHAAPLYQQIGGVPDQLDGSLIPCSFDQSYVSEECLAQSDISGELARYSYPDEHEFELATGPTTALIEAMDWSGARYCAMSRFDLDASVDVRVGREFGLFSPNGDGVLDTAQVLVQALEPLTMSISVHEAVRNVDGGFDLGPAIAQLLPGQAVEGDVTFEWLGDDGVAVLPDGNYGLRFEFTDNCGLTETLDSVGEIDNTPPFVAIDYPVDNDPVGAIVEVLGRFQDINFLSANVDYGTDDIWLNLDNHQRSVFSSRRIATWVLTGLPPATYNLRVQARDRAGNEAEVIVSLPIVEITSLIWALQAEPAYISPNNDGVQDATRIGLGVEGTGLFTVDVRTTGGALVNRLADAIQLPAGSHNFEWDGSDSAGDVVVDGDYVIEVTATDVAQSGFSQVESIGIVVDTVAPDLFLTRPGSPVIQGRGAYIFSTDDLHFASVRVWAQPLEPAGAETLITEELQAGGYNIGDLTELAEGRHRVRLEASDLAGNSALVEREFVVDNTPPEVALFTPLADALIGGANPVVPVTGSVADANFEQYELAVRPAGSMDPWQIIASATELPLDELLTQWTVALVDGDYTLRLLATDQAGLEAFVTVVVNVDTTPPTAIISAPAAESLVTLGESIMGTATDTNFKQYRLRVADADAANPVWSDVAIRDTAVNDGQLLQWNNPPPDGRYRLQLVVEDGVGLSATAETIVLVDQTPPQPPGNLRAQVQPGFNVRLDWDAGSAPDLAGYIVYRNDAALNTVPIVPLNYVDPDVPEGEHDYTVVAVDEAGNQSEPTNTATVTIDRTPPTAVLIAPAEGDRVRGLIPVIGTATSADDFFEYRVYVRPDGSAAPGELLISSPTSVTGEQLTRWDTSVAVQDQIYVVLLEAEDTSGNIGSDERRVLVDNLAPAAPTGLTATLQATNDGLLNWNPNSESDLAGYLLYRNGQLVNGTGDTGTDLLPFALNDITYLDLALADGTQSWQVFAIDQARNVSPGSNMAELVIETGPPDTQITEPDDGERFEQPLKIVAQSPDLDVQSMQFDYRAAGAALWISLGAEDTDPPYQATLDPVALSLVFGDFQIQATATDTGSLADPTPALINVTYADLTAPDDPLNLAATVDGGSVSLTWEHPAPAEVDEFLIYRGDAIDGFEEWDAVAGPDVSYVDTGVADGEYEYYVTAIDAEFNESEPTNTVPAVVFSPQFDHPFTPTQTASVTVAGMSPVPGTISGQLQSDSGTTPVGPLSTAADGTFDLETLTLVDGVNSLEFVVTDTAGNRSKPGIAIIERGAGPSAPLNPAVVVAGFDVTFSWDAPPEPNVVGYRPMRDGQPLLADEAIGGAVMSASSSVSSRPPGNAADGRSTYWVPLDSDLAAASTTFIEAQFSEPRLFTQVRMQWSSGRRPTDYAIEAWSGFVWVPVARVTLDFGFNDTVPLIQPYYTDRLRMVVLDYTNSFWPVRLTEFQFDHRPLDAAVTDYAETRPDGSFDYTVTAVNDLGFEGPPSAVATADVGDVEPPPAVVLSGAVAGSDASLSWTESVAADLTEYRLLRDDAVVFIQTELATRDFQDVGLLNGTYSYQVLAVDAFGNVSDPSNTVELTIAANNVVAPQNLTVSVVAGGSALDIEWQPGAGELPNAYRLRRAVFSGGPYTDVTELPGTSYRDTGLGNGTTYYYVVHAVDAAGNQSAASNEDSGTPIDRLAPAAPVIQSPTVAGQPVTIRTLVTDISGLAEPGVGVEITRNGTLAGTVLATGGFELQFVDVGTRVDNGVVSPDGRYIAQRDFPDRIIALPSGQATLLEAGFAQMTWAADSGSVYAADFDFPGELRRYSVNGSLLDTVVSGWSRIDFGLASPDNQRFLLAGQTVNPATSVSERGIWIFDRTDDSLVRLGSFDSSHVAASLVDWTSDSQQVVFVEREGVTDLQVYDASTDVLQVLQPDVSYSAPDISRDDSRVAFTAQGASSEQIFFIDLAGGTPTQVTDDVQSYRHPQWSLDDRFLGYQDNCCEVFINDLLTGAIVYQADVDFIRELRWLNTDQLHMTFSAEYATVVLPGFFKLENMPLMGGDNEVAATAFDSTGNFSPRSAPILIQVPALDFPDLAILDGDVSVLPAGGAPGDSFQVSLQVRNVGPVAAPAAQVSLRMLRPDGSNVELVAPQGPVALAAGAVSSFSVPIGPLDQEGSYRLVANIDPDGLIEELNETNNLAETTLLITGSSQPLLTLRTDRSEFAPGDLITGTVEVYNPGPLFSGRVEITAEDEAGFVFNFNQSNAITDLDFARSVALPVTWDAGTVFAGTYRWRARLFDQSGVVIQEATQTFAIGSIAEFALALETARSNFEPGSQADFSADLRFVQGNTVVQGASLQWQAIAPSGAVVWNETSPLGTMAPGFRASLPQSWPVGSAAAGTYRIRVELSSSAGFAEAELLVNVVDPAAVLALTGSVAVDSPVIAIGRDFDVAYSVENSGTLEIAAIPVSLRLLRTNGLSQLLAVDLTVDLAVGERLDSLAIWDSTILGFESYLIVLVADLSGQGGSANTILDSASISGIDATPPVLTLISPLDGAITGADVLLVAESADALSAVEEVSVRVDGGARQLMGVANETGVYQRWLFDLAEGSHTYQVRAQDVWGNQTESAMQSFTVDRTPPQIDIIGVADGDLLNVVVQPVITVTDANLDVVAISLNGADFVSSTIIDTEGSYVLNVVATDLAGNRSEATLSFVLDFTPPVVNVTFPASDAVVLVDTTTVTGSTEPGAVVTIRVNSFTAQATADAMGQFSFAAVPLQPGANVLALDAVDAAGNQGPETSLNVTFGAQTIEISGTLDALADPHPVGQSLAASYSIRNDGTIAAAALPVRVQLINSASGAVVATDNAALDVNPSTTVPGSATFATQALPLGLYRVELAAQIDGSWVTLDMAVVTIVDRTAPAVTLLQPAAGSVQPPALTLIASANDEHSAVQQVEYLLDQLPAAAMTLSDPSTGEFQAALAGLAHGQHSVTVQATDAAGNQGTTAPVMFEVDALPPVIEITGVDKGGLYNSAVTPVITVTDDNPDQVEILLDGQPFASGNEVNVEGMHQLTVTATDIVGNSNTLTITFTIDLTGPVVVINAPLDGAEISGGSTDVIASTEPNVVVVLTAGSSFTQTNPANAAGGVTFAGVPIAPGPNTITLYGTDRAGNQGPEVSITVHGVTALFCAFNGEVDTVDKDLNSEFKKKDNLTGTLTFDIANGSITEMIGLIGNYPFSAVPGGPTITFENNVGGRDRILIAGDGQYVGANVKTRTLIAFEIELEDDQNWIESLDDLQDQAWEQRDVAQWRLRFTGRAGANNQGNALPAQVTGTLLGFCTSDEQTVVNLQPLTLAAAPKEVAQQYIDIEGQTRAGATVTLTMPGYSATVVADATGRFVFLQVPLRPGLNTIELVAVNANQTSNRVTLGIGGPAASIPALNWLGLLLLIGFTAVAGGQFLRRRAHQGGSR